MNKVLDAFEDENESKFKFKEDPDYTCYTLLKDAIKNDKIEFIKYYVNNQIIEFYYNEDFSEDFFDYIAEYCNLETFKVISQYSMRYIKIDKFYKYEREEILKYISDNPIGDDHIQNLQSNDIYQSSKLIKEAIKTNKLGYINFLEDNDMINLEDVAEYIEIETYKSYFQYKFDCYYCDFAGYGKLEILQYRYEESGKLPGIDVYKSALYGNHTDVVDWIRIKTLEWLNKRILANDRHTDDLFSLMLTYKKEHYL